MVQNKYIFMILLVILYMVSAVVAMSEPLTNTDNKHNLSSSATHGGPQAQPVSTGGTDRICIFCHTPHSATPATPLWSRPDPNTPGSFPLYNTASGLVIRGNYAGSAGTETISLYKNDGSVTYPSGASRLCLSCHDGATAIGILNDGTTINMVSGQNLVTGTFVIDLSKSHPISFVYNTSVLTAINTHRPGTTYKLPPNLLGDPPAPLDGEDKMQCTTCHDPHEDTNLDGLGLPFWRHNTSFTIGPYEDVCNQCHIGAITPFSNTTHNTPVL